MVRTSHQLKNMALEKEGSGSTQLPDSIGFCSFRIEIKFFWARIWFWYNQKNVETRTKRKNIGNEPFHGEHWFKRW